MIHADYKEQICLFIESRVVKADCVDNIELLRLIKSGWIWDNVLPFMAQTLFKELGNLAVSKPKYL